MKKVTIGNIKYEQAETAEDLPIKRHTALRQYMIYKETGVTVPNLISTISGFVRGFDNESKADMLITLHNYVTGLSQIQNEVDPDQMVYALITFDKDEDKNKVDETLLKEKIERWSNEGLTQGVVEDAVKGFMERSTTHFVTSFQKNLMAEKVSLEE
jgi:hypothetical protein